MCVCVCVCVCTLQASTVSAHVHQQASIQTGPCAGGMPPSPHSTMQGTHEDAPSTLMNNSAGSQVHMAGWKLPSSYSPQCRGVSGDGASTLLAGGNIHLNGDLYHIVCVS